jgi:predicted nicotinamide N-methyase
LKEQVIFQNGQEGKRVWEAGITISRYIFHNPHQFEGKSLLDLGSGTGIGALSAAKFTQCSRIIMSDYTQEILDLLKENSAYQLPLR